MGSPRLVVLDEPTSSLSLLAIEGLKSLLPTLKKRDITILLVAHNAFLLGVADSALYFPGDETARFGNFEDLAKDPAFARLITNSKKGM